MASNKSNLTATAFLCAFVLICGVACSALLFMIVKTVDENVVKTLEFDGEIDYDTGHMMSTKMKQISGPLWTFGLVYAIPAFIGLIGCCTQSKCVFITHMVFSIISLLIMGLAFIGCLLFIGVVAENGGFHCHSVAGRCLCMESGKYVPTGYADCDVFHTVYAYLMAMAVIICLAWILELASTIMSGKLSCCSRQDPGVIIQSVPTTHVIMSHVVGDRPQANDRAILVQNMALDY